MFLCFSGEIKRERVHAAVPLRRVLLAVQAEGTGVPQHRLDRRVCRATPSRKDWQLHSHILSLSLSERKTPTELCTSRFGFVVCGPWRTSDIKEAFYQLILPNHSSPCWFLFRLFIYVFSLDLFGLFATTFSGIHLPTLCENVPQFSFQHCDFSRFRVRVHLWPRLPWRRKRKLPNEDPLEHCMKQQES